MHILNCNKPGTVIGKTLIKRVNRTNDMTGNVSLTYEEWDKIFGGDDIQFLVVRLAETKPQMLEITNQMINKAWWCAWRGCIIMPYTCVA